MITILFNLVVLAFDILIYIYISNHPVVMFAIGFASAVLLVSIKKETR